MDIRKAAVAMLGAALLAVPGLGFGQEAQNFKGMITSHTDNTIVVRVGTEDRSVTLTPETKITGTQGAGVLRRDTRPPEDLIRGLAIEVDAVPAADGLVASSITFKTSDLKTARQIQAGLSETEAGVASNKQAIAEQEERLNNVGNLVAAGRAKVFFAVGSATITAQGHQDLQDIAAKAKAIKGGFRLAVVGRADPSGDAAANKRLSARRALAVKNYLIENCGVTPGYIVPATALGETTVAQDPDPPANAAEARRVTVTIMVSKANSSASH
jgi:outer membrane protein OmpA-like peptidoglycan-associated protein